MKIVIFDKEELLTIGGLVVYTHRFAEHAHKHNHKVSIIRYTNETKINENVFPIPYYFTDPRTPILGPSLITYQLMETYLKKLAPDILYYYGGLSLFDMTIPQVCKKFNIPLVWVWHYDFGQATSMYQQLLKTGLFVYLPLLQQVDLLHVFSQKLKQFYTSHGIAEDKILTLPNGVNTTLYAPGPSTFAKKHKIKRGVLFLGRLTAVKKPELAITSFLRTSPSRDTKMVIMGSGELEDKLKQKYESSQIIFTGAIKNEKQKIDIIRSCQVFILPSVLEGMSLALLEAMACGLACISSDAGNHAEVLGKAGIIIPQKHLSHQTPGVLHALMQNPDLIKKYGQQARNAAVNQYDERIIFDKLLEAFSTAIKHHR